MTTPTPAETPEQPTTGPESTLTAEQWAELQRKGRIEANGTIWYRSYEDYVFD